MKTLHQKLDSLELDLGITSPTKTAAETATGPGAVRADVAVALSKLGASLRDRKLYPRITYEDLGV